MSAPSNHPDPNPCTATALRKAARRVAQLYDLAISDAGLRSTQFAILAELSARTTAPTMAELARALVIDRSALGHNLRPLERDGLVSWSAGSEDRRRRHVALTPEGKLRLREAVRGWRRAQARFDEVFGARAASDLRKTLLSIAHDARLASLADA